MLVSSSFSFIFTCIIITFIIFNIFLVSVIFFNIFIFNHNDFVIFIKFNIFLFNFITFNLYLFIHVTFINSITVITFSIFLFSFISFSLSAFPVTLLLSLPSPSASIFSYITFITLNIINRQKIFFVRSIPPSASYKHILI